jgi:hypothetical protein
VPEAPVEQTPVAVEPPAIEAPAEVPAAAPPPQDPFWGMQRDMGSFIGGMPLPLNAAPQMPQGGAPQLSAPRTPPPRKGLPFGDAPVTFDSKAEVLAEVVAVENDSVPMFGAPASKIAEPFQPMRSDLISTEESADFSFGNAAVMPQPIEPQNEPIPAAAPELPANDSAAVMELAAAS